VILFYQGQEVGRFSGAKSEPFVRDFIEDSLPEHEPPLA
jgi:thioredoxin-like negative regulator of GroEL